MRTLAIVISALISLGGYTQSNKDCIIQSIEGRWSTPVPGMEDSIITFQRLDTITKSRSPHDHFFIANNDTAWRIQQGIWRCGNDPALRMPYPLGYWKNEASCSFSYHGSLTSSAPILYTVSDATENTLTLRRIR
ncbi:MAG: hypothetical protein JST90_17470 [Bacteroidetes bacterium]|nr:hypothetical protein [Bacteroidota bacterium]